MVVLKYDAIGENRTMKKFPKKCYQLSQSIQYYRLKRNLSPDQLAIKIYETEQFIKSIEEEPNSCNIGKLSMDVLFKIADALEVDIRALFQLASEEIFHQYRLDKDKH